MADFELLAPGGHQKLVDEVVDRLDLKADIDGYYAQMTVGSADNLTARGDAVEASFIRRTSGGINDIESGNATIKSIKGNTIRWNQLFKPYVRSTSADGVSYSCDADGKVTMTGTATAANSFTLNRTTEAPSVVNGHKYLLTGGDATAGVSISIGNLVASSYGGIITSTNDGIATAAIKFAATFTGTYVCYPQLFDLTAMFGAGNEPETVAEFEAMYPEPYYAYDAGSLKPVKLNGIETTGFNQWDVSTDGEQYEGHYYIDGTANGYAKTANTNYNCYCVPVFPSTEYCLSVDTGNIGQVANRRYLDADKQFISGSVDGYGSPYAVFTTPANARYVELAISTTSTKNHCINLSWSGRRDGEYEEYWKAERAIAASTYFPTGIKKAGNAYDELTGPEAITRIGSVDLGTLTWTQEGAWQQSKGLTRLSATISDAATASSENVTASGYFESNLTVIGSTMSAAYCIAMMNGRVYVTMPYPEINTGSNFTTWLASHPTTIYYELATPVVTPIDSINLTYKVDDWGTETITGPLGAAPDMDIIYGMNAVDTIRRLPDLYAGKAETEAALAGKADVDGYYSQMTVGAADNLTGRGDTTTAEFLYRTAGGTADIETGQAVAKSVKGNALVWNQLTSSAKPASDNTVNGVTITNNHDGTFTLNGTASAATIFNIGDVTVGTSNHKILIKGCPSGGTADKYRLKDGYGTNSDLGSGVIDQVPNNNTIAQIIIASGYTCDNLVFTPQLFDLTQMFGAGNEPSTVAEFEALFPQPYYEYDAGSLLPVSMTGIETVGFNQWDEQWELGSYNTTNGEKAAATTRIRCKNPIPVFPDTDYYLNFGSYSLGSQGLDICFYDANGDFLSFLRKWSASLTTPTGAYYMTWSTQPAYGTTYNHDICINLSWSGRRNGEYEPFWSSQREIAASTYFPNGMRSAGSVYDELTSTEAITRVGVVDLGTLTWIKDSTSYEFRARRADNPSIPMWVGSAGSVKSNCICSKFTTLSPNDTYHAANVGISISGSVYISVGADSTYADGDAFKAAMSGVYLFYELATPTTTPIDPALNLSYRVDDFGTERVMVPEEERSAPPVLDIAYGLNVVDFVRRAPTEYISAASFRQYLLARDAHDGTTTTMTWDDTDNRYEFAITDTVTEG